MGSMDQYLMPAIKYLRKEAQEAKDSSYQFMSNYELLNFYYKLINYNDHLYISDVQKEILRRMDLNIPVN